MTQFLKYLTARIFFGTFAALFTVYWTLGWVHEVLYAGRGVEDTGIIIWTWVVTVLLVSVLMSLWGRWRFGSMLDSEISRMRREYHPKLLIRGYRRLVRYLDGCWFFNTSRGRLARRVASRFGDILHGMRIEDEEALAIYERILEQEPEKDKFYHFLIRAYARKGRLSRRSLDFLRRRYHERPDDRLVGILAREYTIRKQLNFESERVLLRCLQIYPKHRNKVLDFVVPRLLSYKRTDDNAAMFYMAAAEEGRAAELAPMLRRLEERYEEKGRDDALAYRLARILHDSKVPEGGEPGLRSRYTVPAGEMDWDSAPPGGDGPPGEGEEMRLEGLEHGDESLERQRVEEEGEKPRMSIGSRVHALLQRLFARGGSSVRGVQWKWIRLALVAFVAGALAWYAVPLYERAREAIGVETAEQGAAEQEPAAQEAVEDRQVDEAAERPVPAQEASFAIQIGAFSDSLRAAEVERELAAGGLDSYIVRGMAGGRSIFRVRLGAFASDSSATARARALMRERKIRDWQVVPYISPG